MLKKTVLTLSLVMAAVAAQAQTAPGAPASPAKKELVSRILKLQQPGIEGMARGLVEQPAAELMGNAASALPLRVAKDKQDAVAKEIQGDVRKYLDEAVPLVQGRAIKLAPSTIGTLLEEKFSEEELKQVVAIIESPTYVKFQRMGEDMQKALVEKLVADTRSTIEPKVRTLEQTVAKRLGVTAPAQGAGAAPAKPASK
ncbi:MAG TPA: hypothetical protein VLI46_09810 [Ramlibacter sp.]|nr:hypothetical protein [Ramlibacter sp.]